MLRSGFFTRFQGVCYARKRGRHGRGYSHRWCLRENNLFNGGGYHHAPDRTAGGRDQFLGTEMRAVACPGGQRG